MFSTFTEIVDSISPRFRNIEISKLHLLLQLSWKPLVNNCINTRIIQYFPSCYSCVTVKKINSTSRRSPTQLSTHPQYSSGYVKRHITMPCTLLFFFFLFDFITCVPRHGVGAIVRYSSYNQLIAGTLSKLSIGTLIKHVTSRSNVLAIEWQNRLSKYVVKICIYKYTYRTQVQDSPWPPDYFEFYISLLLG